MGGYTDYRTLQRRRKLIPISLDLLLFVMGKQLLLYRIKDLSKVN